MQPRPLNRHEAPARPYYRAPATTGVVAVHLVVWLLATLAGSPLYEHLLKVTEPTVGALVLSPLIHINGWHLSINLLILLTAGGALETRWGTPRFAVLSAFCLAGGLVSTLAFAPFVTAPGTVSCGSSSLAFGLLAVIGLELPQRRLLRHLPPPRYVVWILIFLLAAFLMGLYGMEFGHGEFGQGESGQGAVHRLLLLPHASGVALGMLFVSLEPWGGRLTRRWAARRADARRDRVRAIRARVDRLLDKISREGAESLSSGERAFLARASKHYRVP